MSVLGYAAVVLFYNPKMWTRLFGEYDPAYTIVAGKHIGLDIGTGRKAIDVPALIGGTVVAVVKSPELGGIVVVQVGDLYYSYCHLAWRNLPKAGTVLEQGDRVGTLASSKDPTSPDYGGSLWDGIHLHLVIGEHPRSAYAKVPGHRTLDKFRDPATIIRGILAAPAGDGARPFNPQEDDMYDENAQAALFAKIEAEARPYRTYQLGSGLILMGPGGATWTIPSGAYQGLLIAWGLTSATVQRVIDGNELAALRSIHGALSPDPRDAQVQAVLDLSEDDAARIAAQIPAPVLTLTPTQLQQIATAAMTGAKTGGADGAKAAIAGLSFVVKAS